MKKLIDEIKLVLKIIFNSPTTYYEYLGYGIMNKGLINDWYNKQLNDDY
jgi:hypothetical protein